jgi:hypothetical protein
MSDLDDIREAIERRADALVALRRANPDGEITDERMERGFAVAEACTLKEPE